MTKPRSSLTLRSRMAAVLLCLPLALPLEGCGTQMFPERQGPGSGKAVPNILILEASARRRAPVAQDQKRACLEKGLARPLEAARGHLEQRRTHCGGREGVVHERITIPRRTLRRQAQQRVAGAVAAHLGALHEPRVRDGRQQACPAQSSHVGAEVWRCCHRRHGWRLARRHRDLLIDATPVAAA